MSLTTGLRLMICLGLAMTVTACKKTKTSDGTKRSGLSETERKARALEAVRMMNKIDQGARQYFSRSWSNETGDPQPCQFPKSTEWTPKQSPCKSESKMFEPDDAAWNTGSWQALLFKISDRHYFQYRVTTSGKVGNGMTAKIQARADLDCNGTWSLYEQTLVGKTAKLNLLNCRVLPGEIIVKLPLE